MKNDISLIIPAAGSSTRMGVNKQFCEVCGIPVIARTMLVFQECESVFEIIVVAKLEDIPKIIQLAEKYKITKFKKAVSGGETRQQSVTNGLCEVSKDTELIAIHDGARPLISADLVEKVAADARIFGGATLGVPVKDTIKVVDDGLITDTPVRKSLFVIQTPQIFKKKQYFEGINFAKSHQLDFTDDCQLMEAIGVKIFVTVGDYKNIKITTLEDLKIAEVFCEKEGKFLCE
ncbi:MAG: 2-C-methyl-D-erythritol 4-phosphate cytidylyltransferase [Oscillospiraceae bacterium]